MAPKQPIFPPGSIDSAEQIKVSPGILAGDYVFLTGVTGSLPDGTMPADPRTQIQTLFDKISAVLKAADLSCAAIVEMTSYHVEIETYFDIFNDIRAEYVQTPYPAWTAVEVAGLRRKGALVEVRAIAYAGQ